MGFRLIHITDLLVTAVVSSCSFESFCSFLMVLRTEITISVCVFAQGVFDHRMKTWQKWQDSQMLLQKKREAEAKLQFTNKPDKLQQAKDEIKEVRRSFRETSSPKITFTMIEMTKYPIRTHGIIPFLIFLLIWSSKLLLLFCLFLFCFLMQ